MPAGKQRLSEMMLYSLTHGEKEAIEHFNLKPETWSRAKREFRTHFGDGLESLIKLKEQFTDEEIKMLATGARPNPHNTIAHKFVGTNLKIGVMSDNHLGSIYCDPKLTLETIAEFNRQKVDMVVHSGDIVEGMMGRPGDVYELTHIGYKAQRDLAIATLSGVSQPLYMIGGNHDCLDPETECLTNRGWLRYEDIRKDDLVLSLDTTTDMAKWDTISEIIVKKTNEPLLSVSRRQFNFMGTPNHRVLHKRTDSRRSGKDRYKDWMYAPASSWAYAMMVPVSAKTGNEDYPINDSMLRLVAWLMTDGSISRRSPSQAGNYNIHQSKDITGIIAILQDLEMDYTVYTRYRNITKVCGKILKKPPLPERVIRLTATAARRAKDFIFDKKTIPEWLYKLSDRQFYLFMQEVKLANGSLSRTKAYAIYGTRLLLDALQILCVTHGYRANVTYDNRGCPKLNVTPDCTTLEMKGVEPTEVEYHGHVWCLSVPLTNFMVRREGRAYFTGNCSYNSKHGVGANIVEDICNSIPNAKYLGHDEGDIEVNGITIRLFHGGDGSSYALSYRGQKLIEAISGGAKPEIFIAGHSHKSIYMPAYRNVHYIEAGTLQWQSSWMRGKKLAAHVGFWILDLVIGENEVKSIKAQWTAFYK